jgi:type I restriction enzyme S subunit
MTTPLSQFIGAINATRDILRREGITGMDSMKHLTLYILARALTMKECKRLAISEQFAWERFEELANQDSRRQECFDLLYNINGNNLISNLDSIFGTSNFNFKLRNPDNHIAILKILKDIHLENLESSVDILGTVYENHLGSGSNKSAMRDLGQFFTDRRVCSYMTSLCNPKTFPDGRAESILDPTMGTGGFLTAYVKYLKDKGVSVDWPQMKMDVAGYDIDDFVMSIGKINMYLSTGVLFPRIDHRDTLCLDVGEVTQRLKFKIILANMPFGVKGLKFAECCKRVKELKCDGTKSEPLFLNLMMAALDDGGRCAVVVPDGVLVNSSKQHDSTRKYLLDHFELKRVIKMKGQFFSNTGIQPSILFFENTGKPTKVVEFWEVEQGSDNSVVEKMLLSVPREKFDDACSLDMRRYQEVTALANTSGFPMVKLGDIAEAENGKILSMEKINSSPGDYPILSGGRDYCGNYNEFNRPEGTISVSKTGSSSGFVKYHTSKFWAADCFTLKFKSSLNEKFIYYTLSLRQEYIYKNYQRAGVMPHCYWSDLQNMQLTLPPLPIQQEIVEALDLIYNNASIAKAAADSVKAQMAAVVRSVNARGYERKKLGDIAKMVKGNAFKSEEFKSEGFPILKVSDLQNRTIDTSRLLYTPQNPKYNQFLVKKNDILLVVTGSSTGKLAMNTTDLEFYLNQNAVVLRGNTKYVEQIYLFHSLLSDDFQNLVSNGRSGSAQPFVSCKAINEFDIPLPPLPIQQEILAMLEEMEAERKAMEQMAAKAEERAKFILDNYLTPVQAANPNPIEMPKKNTDIKLSDDEELVFDE